MAIAIGHMNDDDHEPYIRISKDECFDISRAEEALEILIPIAKRYYRLLQAALPELDDRTRLTHFCHSADCAMQIAQQQNHVEPVDVDAIAANIELPLIADTLPNLLDAYELCRPLWEGQGRRYLTFTSAILGIIGLKMYPVRTQNFHVSGYPDIFSSCH